MTRSLIAVFPLLVLLVPPIALAQPTVLEAGASAPVPPGEAVQGAATPVPGTSATSAPPQQLFFPAGSNVAKTNAESLPSSARPSSNIESSQDGFDLNAGNRDNTVRGSKGSFAITGESVRAVTVPDLHTVRRGDTLWDLCGHYLGNAWDWPRIWSYNPDIRNPNWIYPGDQIRFRSPDEVGGSAFSSRFGGNPRSGASDMAGSRSFGASGARPVPPDTVFLRNQAYIEDPARDVVGEVVGAKEEQMLLGPGNHVYLDVKPGVDLKAGQELTLFEESRKPEPVDGARQPPGEIIVLKGTIRIDSFDPQKRVARAEIREASDTIERGVKVGVVGRQYLVVPPQPAKVTVWARLLSGIHPHVYLGQQQIVFLDRGTEDGLAPGNRLLVVRRGDTWRRSLETAAPSSRVRMRVDLPGNAESEATPLKRDDREFPEEIVGEVRVVFAHRWSSLGLVTASQRELMVGDRAVARAGY